MEHEPKETNIEKIDSITEQIDSLSRLTCGESTSEKHFQSAGESECIIDFEQLLSRVVDEELVEQIMPICIDDNRRNLEKLDEAVSNGNSETIRNYAHSIKGSSSNMGAKQLAEHAGRLERLALEGDLSEANDLLQQIRMEFEKLEDFVANPNWMEIAKVSSS